MYSDFWKYITTSAVAQAVSGWSFTAEARVRSQFIQFEFMTSEVAMGEFYSEYFGFPPFTLILPNLLTL